MRVELRVLFAVCGLACVSGATGLTDYEICLDGSPDDAMMDAACERVWPLDHDEAVVTSGAWTTAILGDDERLELWISRSLPTLEGARAMRFLGDRQTIKGELGAAEISYWRSLLFEHHRAPPLAMNTALSLVDLAWGTKKPEVGMWYASLAWRQARLSLPEAISYAAERLVVLLLDVGETTTAEHLVAEIPGDDSNNSKYLAMGLIDAARGKLKTAAAKFDRLADPNRNTKDLPGIVAPLEAAEAYVDLVDLDHPDPEALRLARKAVERAVGVTKTKGTRSTTAASRLASLVSIVQMLDGDRVAALATLDEALGATPAPRDAALIRLLDTRADVLAHVGRRDDAEASWRRSADSLETWHEAMPTVQLQRGVIDRHRHALEAWLESTAGRGDALASADVVQRVLGRALLDRLREHETDHKTADASIDDVVARLALGSSIAERLPPQKNLRTATRDFTAIMVGSKSVWAIRHLHGAWSVDRVGERQNVIAMVDDYRAKPDDSRRAAALGSALFSPRTLPTDDTPLAVMLDRELADILLPGLRIGDKYLVQYGPIVEILAPEQLFEEVATSATDKPVVIGDSRNAEPLPAAAGEAVHVAKLLDVPAYIHEQATRAAVSRGRHASLLHIAVHSNASRGRSALWLADGELTADTIADERIAPRVAVVATCQSKAGDDPASSLVAAFLAAGASGVIGSKRTLVDRDTAALMHDFYAARGAVDPARALATAQRAAIGANRGVSSWASISFFGVGGWLE